MDLGHNSLKLYIYAKKYLFSCGLGLHILARVSRGHVSPGRIRGDEFILLYKMSWWGVYAVNSEYRSTMVLLI